MELFFFCLFSGKMKSSNDDYVEAIVCQESDIQENE
jgi:hypothetical protein